MTLAALRTPVLATALLAALAPGLAGCHKSEQPGMTPRQALTAAKTRLDQTKGVHVVLSTDKLPPGLSGLVSADGVGTHAPAFKGTVKVAVSGVTADVKVVATQGTVYAVLPFSTQWTRINPADYGAPDPAELMSSDRGLSSVLTAAHGVTEGKQQRDGSEVLTTYSAVVPGSAMAGIMPSAPAGKSFDATFELDSDHTLRKAVLTGPFYGQGGDVTYTVAFDHYGTAPAISAPPTSGQ
jgi:lipoprotein LprG